MWPFKRKPNENDTGFNKLLKYFTELQTKVIGLETQLASFRGTYYKKMGVPTSNPKVSSTQPPEDGVITPEMEAFIMSTEEYKHGSLPKINKEEED